MKNKHIVLILVLLVVALVFSVHSEPIDLEELCTADEECEMYCELNDISEGLCYCSEAESCLWDWDIEVSNETTLVDINTSIPSNATNTTNETASVLSEYEIIVSQLQQEIASLKGNDTTIQQRITTLERSVSTILTQMSQLSTDVISINTVQSQIQQDLSGNINTISTGLAGLQEDVETTQSDLVSVEESANTTRTISYILLFVVILGVGIGGVYYLTRKGSGKGSGGTNNQIVQYITQHIKQGQKYPTIKNALLKAGWSERDIQNAYKVTMKHNYDKYLQQSGRATQSQSSMVQRGSTSQQSLILQGGSRPQQNKGIDKKKTASIAIFSILLLVGVFFLIKGVTTGNAIYFNTEAELSRSMLDLLEKNIDNNAFYEKVNKAHLCIQVQDGKNSASYNIVKVKGKHKIIEAKVPCDYLPPFDFGAKFTNWKSFESVMANPTCSSLKKAHSNEDVYILPSKYVLTGFNLNEKENYSPFCPVLETCFTEKEIEAMDITC
ncbi:hypothetical protein COV17_02880 [Candidatus Woesearchaeota archaeon CG10_big_fil_rev_8_21_14_0_10_36_11]|nr:MAG: hypothetical protein COV17_02880 [Candidatus Woesearchaeota archaeon CG10_big_fil_rev_8_21_14_0_10_36_11]